MFAPHLEKLLRDLKAEAKAEAKAKIAKIASWLKTCPKCGREYFHTCGCK